MKKTTVKIFLLALIALLSVLLTACDIGVAGADGANGLSAYELAVQNGFEGSLDEWLASLKGEDGKSGPRGVAGKDGIDGKDGENGKDGLNYPGSVDGQLTSSFVVVTEYFQPNTGEDVSDKIQAIIDSNPNRTIYFPDGEYVVSKPIKTSAHYERSVSLLLSNYAELKAVNWKGGKEDAIIMLGAAEKHNNIKQPGSYYSLEGGIINGNGKANGVTIDSGRETRVTNLSIKNAVIGLYIKPGANSNSADADIYNVHITCNGASNSVGVLVNAHDNTFENMRIYNAKIGVHLKRGGNYLRYIHPLIGNMNLYEGSIGFYNESGDNWFDICYSDQFETAFKVSHHESTFTNCFSYWWYNNQENSDGFQVKKEIGFNFTGKCNSTIQNTRIVFNNSSNTENAYMKVTTSGGSGIVFNPRINSLNDDNTYQDYLVELK